MGCTAKAPGAGRVTVRATRPRALVWATALPALLLLSLAACSHSTTLRSTPAGAQVYVDNKAEPVGVTPLQLPGRPAHVRLEKDGHSVEVALQSRTDFTYSCANTGLACVASAGILGCVGGSLYLLGVGASAAMPVLTPIITLCGAPPAFLGNLLWSAVGGMVCGALVLPLSAMTSSSIGPDVVEVDLHNGKVRSEPQAHATVVDPAAVTPTSQPASFPDASAAPTSQAAPAVPQQESSRTPLTPEGG